MAFGLQNSEEEREVVQRVYFEGNEEYANMVLRGIIATTQPGFFNRLLGRYGNYPYSEEEVRRDVIRIERFYRRRGFHEIDVNYEVEESNDVRRKILTLRIDENTTLRIDDAQLTIETPDEQVDWIINNP